jgi:CHAT domain-containing protein/tetratricopeptide (TPR) repeat protein
MSVTRHRRFLVSLVFVCAAGWVSVAHAQTAPTPRALIDEAKAMKAKGRFAAQESLATLARVRLEASAHPDTVLLAEALYWISNSRNSRFLFSDSIGVVAALRGREMLRAYPGAPDTLMFVLDRMLGYALDELQQVPRAIFYFREGRAIAKRRLDWGPLPMSVALYNLGNAFARFGSNDSALAMYEEALVYRRNLHQPHDAFLGEIYAGMGMVYEGQGKFDSAAEAFRSAIRSNEAQLEPTHPMHIGPLSRAGAFEFRRGDYALSFDYNRRALQALGSDPQNPNYWILRGSLAQALVEIGDLERARRELEETLPRIESIVGPTHVELLGGRLSLAAASWKLGAPARAREIYEGIQKLYAMDTTMVERGPLVAALAGEARLLYAQGVRDTALLLARRAQQVRSPGGATDLLPLLQALAIEMSVLADQGEWAEVDRVDARLTEELARFALRGSNASDIVWITRSKVASLRGRQGDAVNAAAEGARQARERLTRNVRALSDRQGLLLANSLSEPLDQLLVVGVADPGSLARAWDEVVRTRGLVRAEMTRRRIPASASMDSTQIRAHDAWVRAERRLAQFEVRLASSTHDRESDSIRAAMRSDVDEAERRWATVVPASSLADPGQVGLDLVRTHLRPDQALVGFVQVPDTRGERRLFALVARGGSAFLRSFNLGRVEDLGALTESWLAQLRETNAARRSESACRRAGALVRERIWKPLAAAVGARDLFVVPEAPISGLPLYALPQGPKGYLVESGVRLHVLDAEREVLAEPPARERGLLAVGGVDYGRSGNPAAAPQLAMASLSRAPTADCDSAALMTLPPLPGTDAEARAVEESWKRMTSAGPATRLSGDTATEEAVKTLAPSCGVLHIATHGIVLSDACENAARGTRGVGAVRPIASAKTGGVKRSRRAKSNPAAPALPSIPSPWLGRQVFLALANANHAREHWADENEGLLTAEEVTTLDLEGVDWVVLSACQTAAGPPWTREGRLGMQRAFHLAGARTVIASAWSVEDEATRQWMHALYDARAHGASSAAAASVTASRSVLQSRRAARKSTHPFYWAAFVASGE